MLNATSNVLPSQSELITNSRSLWDIIWGSFATIFACTWIAVHPNIPAREDGEWKVLRYRFKIMMYILLVPELVLYWASKQWYAALRSERKHRGKGWTMTHGFFVGMGGFVLANHQGRPGRPVDLEYLEDGVELDSIEWPTISEEDILDKSKGDYFTKGIAVIQLLWFIIQCLSRAVFGLAIPELELTTLAFAALSGVMYFFWWNKPLDVRLPIELFEKKMRGITFAHSTSEDLSDGHPSNAVMLNIETNLPLPRSHNSPYRRRAQSLPSVSRRHKSLDTISSLSELAKDNNNLDDVQLDLEESHVYLQGNIACPAPFSLHPCPNPIAPQKLHFLPSRYLTRTQEQQTRPRTYATTLLYPIKSFINDLYEMRDSGYITSDSVSQFYAGARFGIESWISILLFVIGSTFGAIHCTAWGFDFPTSIEKWLWRSTSVGIATLPIITAGNFFLVHYFLDSYVLGERNFILETSQVRLSIFIFLYITSRIVLLVLPLVQLRSLSPAAYLDVDWTQFLPRII